MTYHVNPQTKTTGRCRASTGRCPFGSTTEHFDSANEAQERAEQMLETEYSGTTALIRKDPEKQAARDWAKKLRQEKALLFSDDTTAEIAEVHAQALVFWQFDDPETVLAQYSQHELDSRYGAGAYDRFKHWHNLGGDITDALVMERQTMVFKRMNNPDVILQSLTPNQVDTIWGFNAYERFNHWQHGGTVSDTAPNESHGRQEALKRIHLRRQYNQQAFNVLQEVRKVSTKIGGHFDPKKVRFSANPYGNLTLRYPQRQPMHQYQHPQPAAQQQRNQRSRQPQQRQPIRSMARYPLGTHPIIAQALMKAPAKMTVRLVKLIMKHSSVRL